MILTRIWKTMVCIKPSLHSKLIFVCHKKYDILWPVTFSYKDKVNYTIKYVYNCHVVSKQDYLEKKLGLISKNTVTHTPSEGIFSKTSPPLWKFQLSFMHFFQFLSHSDLNPPNSPGNSNFFHGGSMDIFYNCTFGPDTWFDFKVNTRDGSRGRVQGVRTPPWDDLRPSNRTGILQKIYTSALLVLKLSCTPPKKKSWIRPWTQSELTPTMVSKWKH